MLRLIPAVRSLVLGGGGRRLASSSHTRLSAGATSSSPSSSNGAKKSHGTQATVEATALLQTNLDKLWSRPGEFGDEREATDVYTHRLVPDRLRLVRGMRVQRDELTRLTDQRDDDDVRHEPTAVVTLAHTNCGDRIHQDARSEYVSAVGSRFAAMSETGATKIEGFYPTGGGVDDADTLVHVTVDHQLKENIHLPLRNYVMLYAFDVMTHSGRNDQLSAHPVYGESQESPAASVRGACGAIRNALGPWMTACAPPTTPTPTALLTSQALTAQLRDFVMLRLQDHLGRANHATLQQDVPGGVKGSRFLVGSAIVAVEGMLRTLHAFQQDYRGLTAHPLLGKLPPTDRERHVAHCTASVVVNRVSLPEAVIPLARGTCHRGEIRVEGHGTVAKSYTVRYVKDPRHGVVMSYAGDLQQEFKERYADATA